MRKKVLTILNIIALIIIIGVFVIFAFNFSNEIDIEQKEGCIEVNKVASFVQDTCYDAYSKKILMSLERSYDTYNIKSIAVSFFDFSEKSYEINDVPAVGGKKAYKISAERNPETIKFKLNVIKDFSSPICPEPREIFVKYCPPGSTTQDIDVTIKTGDETDDYIEVGNPVGDTSDKLTASLVEKERIWQSKCDSRWTCTAWEECHGGIQKRECIDSNKCMIPTEIPDFTKYCNGTCVENWECSWSKCTGGFTTPDCRDLNRCGTSYNIPQKIDCKDGSTCNSDITCSGWSECNADYNFLNLLEEITEIQGTKTRVCTDNRGCTPTKYESTTCSLRTDIYTKKIIKCGTEYIGIYNKLTNEQIARIEQSKLKNNPFINIQLTQGEQEYCDYCFDGIKDGDEEQTDCGGSCKTCEEKHTLTTPPKKSFSSRLQSFFERILI